ncbi:MAG: hypothetical protein BYD32DRAFT_421319 [Podila humilis]|nr:MAG: hypothetical protein BYD32DRAFT_421319 [Podila humilis]
MLCCDMLCHGWCAAEQQLAFFFLLLFPVLLCRHSLPSLSFVASLYSPLSFSLIVLSFFPSFCPCTHRTIHTLVQTIHPCTCSTPQRPLLSSTHPSIPTDVCLCIPPLSIIRIKKTTWHLSFFLFFSFLCSFILSLALTPSLLSAFCIPPSIPPSSPSSCLPCLFSFSCSSLLPPPSCFHLFPRSCLPSFFSPLPPLLPPLSTITHRHKGHIQ